MALFEDSSVWDQLLAAQPAIFFCLFSLSSTSSRPFLRFLILSSPYSDSLSQSYSRIFLSTYTNQMYCLSCPLSKQPKVIL